MDWLGYRLGDCITAHVALGGPEEMGYARKLAVLLHFSGISGRDQLTGFLVPYSVTQRKHICNPRYFWSKSNIPTHRFLFA